MILLSFLLPLTVSVACPVPIRLRLTVHPRSRRSTPLMEAFNAVNGRGDTAESDLSYLLPARSESCNPRAAPAAHRSTPNSALAAERPFPESSTTSGTRQQRTRNEPHNRGRVLRGGEGVDELQAVSGSRSGSVLGDRLAGPKCLGAANDRNNPEREGDRLSRCHAAQQRCCGVNGPQIPVDASA